MKIGEECVKGVYENIQHDKGYGRVTLDHDEIRTIQSGFSLFANTESNFVISKSLGPDVYFESSLV